jgi:hypothetical protein
MAFFRVLPAVPLLTALLAVSGSAYTIPPDVPFSQDFTIPSLPFPDTPDELDVLIIGSGSFDPVGPSSAVTTSLYDGTTLLGSYQVTPGAGAFSSLWLASFFSAANPFGTPTIDFTTIANRTIQGRLEIAVTGASLTIDSLPALKMDISHHTSPTASEGYLFSVVPEPGYGALAAAAGIAMAGWRRFRKNR